MILPAGESYCLIEKEADSRELSAIRIALSKRLLNRQHQNNILIFEDDLACQSLCNLVTDSKTRFAMK
jgi:hypothetical protein